MPSEDVRWMREALKAARGGMYLAPPNPSVGCVIVRDGREISRGFTQKPGGHHAEIEAIERAHAAGESVAGATVYVTLEPCSHYGRTPPCALRLISERVGRVVAACTDPNPLVAGKGLLMLAKAGIEVKSGVCAREAEESNIGFMTRMRRGTPWVRMKIAGSLDGRTALPGGASRWITSEMARADGRLWRARSQGLLTGIGTVLADDPGMDVRLGTDLPSPAKFVLDCKARTPVESKILRGSHCTVFVGAQADGVRCRRLEGCGAEVVRVAETSPGRLDLKAVLDEIGRRSVNELHIEAGSVLSGALLEAGFVDELLLYEGPCMLGAGRPLAELAERVSMEEVLRWRLMSVRRFGDDVRLLLRRAK